MSTPYSVNEQTTAQYTATVTDEAGAALQGATLVSLTLTLYDKASGTVINARNAQNVLQQNGVTVDSAGLLTWRLDPADNAMIGTAQQEYHVALFTWTWGSPLKTGRHEVLLQVKNLTKVP